MQAPLLATRWQSRQWSTCGLSCERYTVLNFVRAMFPRVVVAQVYSNPGEAAAKGKQARMTMVNNFTPRRLASFIRFQLQRIASQQRVEEDEEETSNVEL